MKESIGDSQGVGPGPILLDWLLERDLSSPRVVS